MKTRLSITAAVAAAALALPVSASAAGTVVAGPVAVKGGYQLVLSATDGKRDTFNVSFHKRVGKKQTEMVSTSFVKGVSVSVKGASASIKGTLAVGAMKGSKRWGKVDLRLRNVRTVKGRKLPAGCKGKPATTRTGTLTGRLDYRLPNGKKGTIRSLRGLTYIGGKINCAPTGSTGTGSGDGEGDGVGEPSLTLSKTDATGTLSFMATRKSLNATWIDAEESVAPAMVVRNVSVSGSGLLNASGTTSATVKAAGSFTGAGSFSATSTFGDMGMGPLSGNLSVRIPGLSSVAIVGDSAILRNPQG